LFAATAAIGTALVGPERLAAIVGLDAATSQEDTSGRMTLSEPPAIIEQQRLRVEREKAEAEERQAAQEARRKEEENRRAAEAEKKRKEAARQRQEEEQRQDAEEKAAALKAEERRKQNEAKLADEARKAEASKYSEEARRTREEEAAKAAEKRRRLLERAARSRNEETARETSGGSGQKHTVIREPGAQCGATSCSAAQAGCIKKGGNYIRCAALYGECMQTGNFNGRQCQHRGLTRR
jgi:membrane protein involved in colicin uptake